MTFCKQCIWVITSLVAPLTLAVAPAAAQKKPNILVIMGDESVGSISVPTIAG